MWTLVQLADSNFPKLHTQPEGGDKRKLWREILTVE